MLSYAVIINKMINKQYFTNENRKVNTPKACNTINVKEKNICRI
jgi:hypothetical protein